MSVRQIVYSSDPMLHEPSEPVRRVDEGMRKLVEDMVETMHAADGIGLAAVQVGVPERVIVIEMPVISEDDDADQPPQLELYVMINPELVSASGESMEGIEGCLSLPGWVGEVVRHQAVLVEGLDLSGRPIRVEAEGLLARILQHEIDHCEGVLFIDHIEDPEKVWRVEEGQEEVIEATQELPSE